MLADREPEPPRDCARVQDDRRAATRLQRGQHVLHPAPIRRRARRRPLREAAEVVVLVKGLLVAFLVPHGIRNHAVELEELALRAEAGLSQRVPDGKAGVGVAVQEHVHLGHGERHRVQLLAVEPGRSAPVLRPASLERQPRLDEQPARAAGRIVDRAEKAAGRSARQSALPPLLACKTRLPTAPALPRTCAANTHTPGPGCPPRCSSAPAGGGSGSR